MRFQHSVVFVALILVFAGVADVVDANWRRHSIVGTWDLVASVDGAEEPGLATYGVGGTTIVVNQAPPAFAKTGQGAWVRTGRRTFESTFRVYVYDGMGNFQFTLSVKERILLASSGNEYRGKFKGELVFPDGSVVPGAEGTTHAKRIVVN